jgi:hypothetical protein
VILGLNVKRVIHYAWANYFSGIESKDVMFFLPPKEVSEVVVKTESSTSLATSDTIEWSF